MFILKNLAAVGLFISIALMPVAITEAKPGHKKPVVSPVKQDKSLAGLQEYVNELMKKLPVVPGLVVAVVKGDQIIFAQGFGYRNLKSKLPVTPQTLFYVASSHKSFTATTARILVDEGKLDLDAPLKTYFPTLTLPAPLSMDQLSLRDLLAMRAGFSNNAVGFRTSFTGQSDKEEMLRLLSAYTKPIPPVFTYDNLGYIIAAYAMENVTGETWQQLIQKKILEPMGMKTATFYASKAIANPDIALPYSWVNGEFIEVPYKRDNQMHAAGGMSVSGEDLAKWLIMNLNQGKFEGKQIISARSLEEIHSPQTNQKVTWYKFNRYAWGLGWDIADYEGDKMLHRFGGYPGFRPHVSFMPAHHLGVIVLTNTGGDGSTLTDLIASDIYDHLLRKKAFKVEGNPKVEEYLVRLQRNKERRTERAIAQEKEREKGTKPGADLKSYAGIYESPEYGSMTINLENNSLVVTFGNFSAVATHYQRDVFDVAFIPGNTDKLNFEVSPEKEITKLSAVVFGERISFTKVK